MLQQVLRYFVNNDKKYYYVYLYKNKDEAIKRNYFL